MIRRPLAVLLMLAGLAAPVAANDSIAELRAGGLVFVTTDTIVMEQEDLFVSRDEIRVDYVFRNTADEDQTLTVAFPMPDIEGNPWVVPSIPDMEQANFLDFSVTVDGESIEPTLQQIALAAGIDVTETINAAGVPLEPLATATSDAVEALPAQTRADWVARGLLIVQEWDDDGTGMKKHWVPFWTLKTTYHWQMTFLAGEETRVSHRYKPGVGGSAGIVFSMDQKVGGEDLASYRKRYCMDAAFEKAVNKRLASQEADGVYLMEHRIAYVLTTGNNWAGPIRDFRLTVDKGDPDSLVSFCGEGVRKTGPTTFEMRATDYYPDRDLEVLIVTGTKVDL